MEEYKFENGTLVSQKIKKADPKVLTQENVMNEIIPDKMTTFKISLDDNEKQARDELVLPYLPKYVKELLICVLRCLIFCLFVGVKQKRNQESRIYFINLIMLMIGTKKILMMI